MKQWLSHTHVQDAPPNVVLNFLYTGGCGSVKKILKANSCDRCTHRSTPVGSRYVMSLRRSHFPEATSCAREKRRKRSAEGSGSRSAGHRCRKGRIPATRLLALSISPREYEKVSPLSKSFVHLRQADNFLLYLAEAKLQWRMQQKMYLLLNTSTRCLRCTAALLG